MCAHHRVLGTGVPEMPRFNYILPRSNQSYCFPYTVAQLLVSTTPYRRATYVRLGIQIVGPIVLVNITVDTLKLMSIVDSMKQEFA